MRHVSVRLNTVPIYMQVYTRSAWFPHSPSASLKWKARSKALCSTLQALDADIFLLQEVDAFNDYYAPALDRLGYACVYKQRTGTKKDGSAICYRKNKFKVHINQGSGWPGGLVRRSKMAETSYLQRQGEIMGCELLHHACQICTKWSAWLDHGHL